ncbi:MAG: SIMPL domain-containing protein [Deltaproteobacteria bacterium]|nr:SIMPL domain-containing protein [Deltaproteobacteria bacterium]
MRVKRKDFAMLRHLLTNRLMIVTAFLVLFPCSAHADDAASPTTANLEVIGRAAIQVTPDVARIAFTVETNARQASEAVSSNAQKTETLLTALRKIMGPEDKVQTTRFNLQPVYDKDDRLRPSGYRVGNRITVDTMQMDKIGDLIDAAAASNAGQISNLQFRSTQEAAHRLEAAVLAVEQARSDAEKLARAAVVVLGPVLRIRYAPQGAPGVFFEKAAMAMSRTPIEVGDLTIEAEVSMVFEIN